MQNQVYQSRQSSNIRSQQTRCLSAGSHMPINMSINNSSELIATISNLIDQIKQNKKTPK